MKDEKKPLNADTGYEFYDDYEVEDIYTGEVVHHDSSPAQTGLIGAGLALLACLVLVGLSGILYHRDRKSVPLSFMIMAILAVLAACLIAFICLQSKGAINRH